MGGAPHSTGVDMYYIIHDVGVCEQVSSFTKNRNKRASLSSMTIKQLSTPSPVSYLFVNITSWGNWGRCAFMRGLLMRRKLFYLTSQSDKELDGDRREFF